MNSSTFSSCSCDSSAPASGSGIYPPVLSPKPESSVPRLRARVQHPEARDVGGAVVSRDGLERLHGALPLARHELRLAERELRVLGTLEAAFLDALLDERQALVRLALVDVVHAELHQLLAARRRERLALVLRPVVLGGRHALVDERAQTRVALGLLAGAERFHLVALVDDLLRLGGGSGLQRELRHLHVV